MGIVTFGIPKQIILDLARLNGSTAFIETGTYRGGTTRWAATNFEVVHTIEKAESLFDQYSPELAQIKGVVPHLGDSRDILPQIVEGLKGRKAIYWLDGHWSGEETYGEQDECPLMGELAALSNRPEDIIVIDDARLFLSAPPLPHVPSQWPTISDIIYALPSSGKRPFVQVVDDVIFIVPDQEALRNCLVAFAQDQANRSWEQYQKKANSWKAWLRYYVSKLIRG
jgi:hypothetical protein